ncbi:cytochrome P450 315a1, mitochondrial-like [Penaeus indicus]|uniref:cytochrome P450 315a1, mitochondrial-like n=1 Tax=Penaeus indicus TaxID=29960 RepID=UPI00300D38E8
MSGRVPKVLRRVRSFLNSSPWRARGTLASTHSKPDPHLVDSTLTQAPPPPATPKTYEQVPTPLGYPLLGTLPEFLAAGGVQNFHKYATQRHRQLGSIYRERIGGADLLFVSDPATVRQVFAAEGPHPQHFIPEAWTLYNEDRRVSRGLFFMDGEEWKASRSVLNRRLLRRGCMEPHQRGLAQVADQLLDRWVSRHSGQVIPDLERQLYHWGIRSLGAMVLGGRTTLLADPSDDRPSLLDDFSDAIHGIFKQTCAMGTFPPTLARKLRLPMWARLADTLDQALAYGNRLVQEGIAEAKRRQGEGEEAVLLLDQLLQDDVGEENVARLLTDMFLAAADTTTHTTIWTLYLLGKHPEAAARIRQEVLDATGGSGDVRLEHLASLSYLKGVVKEALRLYPVAPFQTRVLATDTNLGGYVIPGGTMVVLSVYTMARDAAHFSNPDSFCPERWQRDFSSSACPANGASSSPRDSHWRLHSHAFIPFGVGVRSCIGRLIAETQLYLLLAKLASRCHLTAVNDVDLVMRMVGVTSEPLKLRIDAIDRPCN